MNSPTRRMGDPTPVAAPVLTRYTPAPLGGPLHRAAGASTNGDWRAAQWTPTLNERGRIALAADHRAALAGCPA